MPVYAAGERVVQVGRTRGTVRATGEPFDAVETPFHHVRDNLIVAFEAYVDTDERSRAFGATQAPDDTEIR